MESSKQPNASNSIAGVIPKHFSVVKLLRTLIVPLHERRQIEHVLRKIDSEQRKPLLIICRMKLRAKLVVPEVLVTFHCSKRMFVILYGRF